MGENQWNWRRPLAVLVDEMDTYTLRRRIAIVVKGGHFLNLPLPIELILASIGKCLSCSRDLPRNPSVNLESGPATASAPASGEDLRPPLPSTGHQISERSFPSVFQRATPGR